MSYDVKDTSVHDGEPIEVFKFIGTLGTYRYTDYPENVTVNGELYITHPISRTAIEVGTLIDSITTMDFTVLFDSDLARAHGLLATPDSLLVEVRRVHKGDNYATDWEMTWQGIAVGYSMTGRWFTIGTQNKVQVDLNTNLAQPYYQTTCNHVLFDERCKVNKASNTSVSTVTVIGPTAITVASDGVPDGHLRAGELINQRTGERRLILDNLANVIDIGYGFIDILVGDTVSMVKGCDHSFSECQVRFSNLDNFGGFMYVPSKNPFTQGV